MTKAEFKLEPLTCPTCVKKIEGALGKMKGIDSGRVLFNSSKVKVTFDETSVEASDIADRIGKLGYAVLSTKVN